MNEKSLQTPIGLIFELNHKNVFTLFCVYSVVKELIMSVGSGFCSVALLFVVRITLFYNKSIYKTFLDKHLKNNYGVKESFVVVSPRHWRELHFSQFFGTVFASTNVSDSDSDPIRTRITQPVGKPLAVLWECGDTQRSGSVFAQQIRVQKDSRLRVQRIHNIEHRLVLKTGIHVIEVIVSSFEGTAISTVIPELGQSLIKNV